MSSTVKAQPKKISLLTAMTGLVVSAIVIGFLSFVIYPAVANAEELDAPVIESGVIDVRPDSVPDNSQAATIELTIPADERPGVWASIMKTAREYGLAVQVYFTELAEDPPEETP